MAEMPLTDLQRKAATSDLARPDSRAWGRILIAEDEELVRKLIAEWLHEEGYQCDCVGTAKDAVAALATGVYDLLITDIRLPDNETLVWLQTCRSEAPAVPVIVMTGYPSVGTAVEAVRHSVVDYLVKPVDAATVRTSVHHAIGKGRVLRTLRKAREEMRLWVDAMDRLEASLAAPERTQAGTTGAWPIETVLQQTLTLYSQIVISLKTAIATCDRSGGQSKRLDLCALTQCPKGAAYEAVLRRSVEVLVSTKNSFKSKELGDLRKVLAEVLKQESGG